MAEEDLLEIAQQYDALTDEAQAALRGEFLRRKLDPPLLRETEAGVPSSELVTIRRYRDLSEGIVARSLLESAGMHVELRDENLVRLDWQVSNFIGGLRLQVLASDAEEAVALLDQDVVDPVPFAEDTDFSQPRCPRCGSTGITFEGSARGAALASLFLFAVPLPAGRATWRCSQCNNRWAGNGG